MKLFTYFSGFNLKLLPFSVGSYRDRCTFFNKVLWSLGLSLKFSTILRKSRFFSFSMFSHGYLPDSRYCLIFAILSSDQNEGFKC